MTRLKVASGDVQAIHDGTAIYTSQPEIEKLLDQVDWPASGGALLDPGCGNGNMVVTALTRLRPAPGDMASVRRIHGIEFHKPSACEARQRCMAILMECGWNPGSAKTVAEEMITCRDYLQNPPRDTWDIVLSNPPYWRRARLPAGYRTAFDACVPKYASADMLHAYLAQITHNVAPGGIMALITSDRWLTNSGAARLREHLGADFRVSYIERLDSKSAFHRPKKRIKDSPPRVHAVSMILGSKGRLLGSEPFVVESLPAVDGVPLPDLVSIRLAPWLGPDGIFLVDAPDRVPGATTVPCVMPKGIDPANDQILEPTRWALVTGDEKPGSEVIKHLESQMARMPERGRRSQLWQPPERFDHHLPLATEGILVPRIAKTLRAVPLPAGMLPINHSLVVVVGKKLVDGAIEVKDRASGQRHDVALADAVADIGARVQALP